MNNKSRKAVFILIAILSWAPFLVEAGRTGTIVLGGYFTSVGDANNTIYYNTGPIDIGDSVGARATLFVKGYSGSASSTLQVASSTGITTFDVSSTGTTSIRQFVGFAKPTIATSTGAGSVAATSTLGINSSDLAGSIYLTTGSAPAANTTIVTVTSASSSQPYLCMIQPMNAITASAATSTSVATTSAGFSIGSGTTGLSATTSYQWGYLCN